MKKFFVEIDGMYYLLVLQRNNLLLFEFKNNKLQRVYEISDEEKSKIIHDIIVELLINIEKDINNKIKHGEYKNVDEITNEIRDRINMLGDSPLDLLENIDFESYDEYQDMIRKVSEKFKEMSNQEKKEVIENKVDVDLRTLFAENGIKEYEVSPSKSVITYEKNGEVHTLINTDPNSNIYDLLFKNLEFDKLYSREDLDKEITRIMDLEKEHKYQNNKTSEYNELEDYEKSIADYLAKEYGYTNIKGIVPEDSSVIDGGWIVELSNGEKIPIFATKNESGALSITFGKEKQVDSVSRPDTEIKQLDEASKIIEEEVNEQTRDEQLLEIYQKFIINGQELSDEEKAIVEFYNNNEEEFYKLTQEARDICQEIINAYNEIYHIKDNPNERGRQYKLESSKKNPDESGLVYVGIVTFLSGMFTGFFVYLFFKMFF